MNREGHDMKDTVLIVGRDAHARAIARTLLWARNLHVLSTTDPTEACDVICCEGASVVVLDLTFPDTKGLELLRRLRGRFETRVLPAQPRVIVVADWGESAVERLALGLGRTSSCASRLTRASYSCASTRCSPRRQRP